MSIEGEAHSIANILSGFSSAESVAEDVIEQILTEGGRRLYSSYIERKSFSFGSEAISNLLISELKMCFVRHDGGEPPQEPGVRREGSPQFDIPVVMEVPSVPQSMGRDMSTFSASAPEELDPGMPRPAPIEIKESAGDAGGEASAVANQGGADASGLPPDDVPPREVSCCSWALEAEPQRCRIDTWARACVPVRRALVRPKNEAAGASSKRQMSNSRSPNKKHSLHSDGRSARGTPLGSVVTPSHGSKAVNQLVSPSNASEAKKNPNDGMIPLVEPVEVDEEETAMREMKEREAKRKREEENRIERKNKEEAEEAARLAQVKDQMKNKPYTYDSAGNIIWVTAFPAEKLPSANPVPTYVFRREVANEERIGDQKPDKKGGSRKEARHGSSKLSKGKAKEIEFVDTFKKFSSQQPMMMEAMKMAPGVRLSERGMSKNGEDASGGAHGNSPMTRRDYENLVKSGTSGYPPKDNDENRDVEGSPQSNTQSAQQLPAGTTEPGEATATAEPAADRNSKKDESPRGTRGVKAVAPTSATATATAGLVPHAPSTPRPVQPAPPASMRRVQLKRDAVGYNLSSRERVPTGTGSRFPGCAAPPLLGATMGHGLLPQGSKHQEYYFPNSKNSLGHELRIVDEEDPLGAPSAQGSSALPSPRELPSPHGQITSKNPELVRRLFNH